MVDFKKINCLMFDVPGKYQQPIGMVKYCIDNRNFAKKGRVQIKLFLSFLRFLFSRRKQNII